MLLLHAVVVCCCCVLCLLLLEVYIFTWSVVVVVDMFLTRIE